MAGLELFSEITIPFDLGLDQYLVFKFSPIFSIGIIFMVQNDPIALKSDQRLRPITLRYDLVKDSGASVRI
jgi:hypothetical protein